MKEKEIVIPAKLVVREGAESAERTKAELAKLTETTQSIASLLGEEESKENEDGAAEE